MAGQLVTIAVIPHERFSLTKDSLEGILAHRGPAAELVYIDGGSPPLVRQYLEQQAARQKFRLISTEKYVAPNTARNLAIRQVRTKYVALVDNDVLVSPGWLDPLVDCAESTGAWVVGPVCCQGEGTAARIHSAGGTAAIITFDGRRAFREAHPHQGRLLNEVRNSLRREPVGQIELRAALVKTEALARLGPLDEELASGLEHTDLCLSARELGGEVYREPGSVVTYVPPPPFDPFDLPYFHLRWSDAWNRATVERFCEKWGLPLEDPGIRAVGEGLTDHRRLTLEPVRRLLRLLGHRPARWLERAVIGPFEKAANRHRFPTPPHIAEKHLRRAA